MESKHNCDPDAKKHSAAELNFLGLRGPLVLPLVDPDIRLPVRAKNFDTYIQAYMPHESSGDSSNQPDGPMGSPRRLP